MDADIRRLGGKNLFSSAFICVHLRFQKFAQKNKAFMDSGTGAFSAYAPRKDFAHPGGVPEPRRNAARRLLGKCALYLIMLNIAAAKLAPDGKTVTLTIDDFRPAMVEIIRFNLNAKDGTPIASEIQHTINAIL